jgi:hypothetical protein
MKNRISAQESHTIAMNSYVKRTSVEIEKFLDEIYKEIETSSQEGNFKVSVDINIFANSHRDKIAKILESDGYKVSYNYRDYDSQDYIRVSWKTPNTIRTLNQLAHYPPTRGLDVL